jgi:tetratricopeptide (TPR) repeat protein
MAMKVGVAQKFFDNRLLLDLDFDPMASQIFLGGEMRFHQVAVRMGINSSETSAGFGYAWKNYSFDYAIVYSSLLLSNRISVNCSFGPNLQKERERRAMALYHKAEDSYGTGKYRKAMDYFGQGFVLFDSLDYHKKADTLKRFMDQYGLADASLAKKGDNQLVNENVELTKNMVKAYLDGNLPQAARNARIILSTNAGNELAKEISKAISNGDTLEMQGLTKESIIEVKLQRAVKYFNDKDYEKAIKECREVIELDPNNEMAYVRLGSAYLMFGAQAEAKKIWEKALEINPKNKDLQEFMKRLK